MTAKRIWVFLVSGMVVLSWFGLVSAGEIEFLSPAPEKLVIGKRPLFKWKLPQGLESSEVLILLDGMDITELVSCQDGVCSFRPIQPLPAGDHVLEVDWQDTERGTVVETLSFSSRQSKLFREIYSKNSAGVNYQLAIHKDNAPQQPNSRIDGSFNTKNRLQTRYWTFSASGQVRYVDQDHPIQSPEQKGFDLINFLLESVYQRGSFRMDAQFGDITVNETENTINNYARKGAQVFFDYKDFGIHLFSTNTAQYYGLNGGLGVDIDPNDNLYGASGTMGFLDRHVLLKAIYAKGGEEGSSFGISTISDRQRGKVAGVMLDSNWFDSRMAIRAEYDVTEYDSSSEDEFGPESDKAYKASISWDDEFFGVSGLYEYMGPDYEVIGNQGLPKNREGFTLGSWLALDVHRFELLFSRYNDNVKDDRLYPRVYDYQGGIRYFFNKYPTVPISIYYQKNIQNSTDEPEYTPEIYYDTDTVGGDISWLPGNWSFNLHTDYSYQNDKAHSTDDTATITVTFAPGYTGTCFRINPSFSYNKSIAHLTDVETDTYMANWDMEWQLTDRIVWSFAGNFNYTTADDDSIDMQTLDLHSRIAYTLFNSWLGLVDQPTVGFRTRYNWQDDKTYGQSEDSLVLMIDFTSNFNFTF